MRKRSGVWAGVDELLAQDEIPAIVLPKAAKIIGHVPRPVGRPRKADKRPKMATPSGRRMRCRAHRCGKDIGANCADIVCSERCRAELLTYVSLVKDILLGNIAPIEYPSYYRAQQRRKVA